MELHSECCGERVAMAEQLGGLEWGRRPLLTARFYSFTTLCFIVAITSLGFSSDLCAVFAVLAVKDKYRIAIKKIIYFLHP